MDIISNIQSFLDKKNITYVINDNCENFHKLLGTTVVTICTNAKAFANYDDEHPERIVCILVYEKSYLVIPKDRDLNIDTFLQFWKSNYKRNMNDITCSICFEQIRKNLPMIPCSYCTSCICVKCNRKIEDDIPDAFQCVSCRQWNLSGCGFGRPYDQLTHGFKNKIELSTDEFVTLLDSLEGNVLLIPRVNNEICIQKALSYCKLAFTNRYESNSPNKNDIRKLLKKFSQPYVYIYTIRNTYKIHAESNLPIVDTSAFMFSNTANSIFQLNSNAYMQLDIFDKAFMQKIEYIQPYKFGLPELYKTMFEMITTKYKHDMTISISVNHRESGNFDVTADGEICTMTDELLELLLYRMLRYDKIYIASRIHETTEVRKYCAGEIQTKENKCIWYTQTEAKRFFHKNFDGLKNTVYITEFTTV